MYALPGLCVLLWPSSHRRYGPTYRSSFQQSNKYLRRCCGNVALQPLCCPFVENAQVHRDMQLHGTRRDVPILFFYVFTILRTAERKNNAKIAHYYSSTWYQRNGHNQQIMCWSRTFVLLASFQPNITSL